MLAALLGAIRTDVDRQIGWAKDEARRQTRYSALIGVYAALAALAILGAIVVALIAAYLWLAVRTGPFAALSIIGGGLLLLGLILLTPVSVSRRPRVAARPQLQIARPMALLGTLRQGNDQVSANNGHTLRLATDTAQHGSRSALLGMLVLVVAAGLIAGRRL